MGILGPIHHTLVLNSDGAPIGFIPLSSLDWQDAIRAVYLDSVTTVHVYENWTVHSPRRSIQVPSVVMTKRYVRPKKMVAFTAEMVKLRDGYRCQYCGNRFASSKLTMDHVVPRSKGGGGGFSNFVAACSPCNNKRGNNTAIQPRSKPYRPSVYDLLPKARQLPIVVPHESWLPYVNWPDRLVTIEAPRWAQERPSVASDKDLLAKILKPELV